MSELKYWIWFSTLRGIGARRSFELLEHFGSPEKIYFARDEEYSKIISGDVAPLMNKSMSKARRIIDKCDENGINIITLNDAAYPSRLKNIFDPPLALYVKGRLPVIDEEAAIAIVGTRNCTPYGVITAERIGYEVTRAGGLIISGLARGIDTAAAKGALRAGGRVVGVLGCGVDVVYPASNAKLFEDVAAAGAIISEYPPETPPEGKHFPERNRILSGLSVGVTVIEAPVRSGALITASLALEQGRDVFAVPGNVDSESCKGSNGLLKEGAMAALSGWDITELYESVYPDKLGKTSQRKTLPLDNEEAEKLVKNEMKETQKRQDATKKVFDKKMTGDYIDIMVDPDNITDDELSILNIMDGTMHIDEIIEKTGLPASRALSAVTMLEISGALVQEAGKRFTPHFRFCSEINR